MGGWPEIKAVNQSDCLGKTMGSVAEITGIPSITQCLVGHLPN